MKARKSSACSTSASIPDIATTAREPSLTERPAELGVAYRRKDEVGVSSPAALPNPRPADYEKYGPAHRAHCLHGCHGAVPPMALIAQLAHIARSTSRSTPHHGDHRMSATESHRRLGLICQGYGRRATWSIWTIPPFFVDRVEDAVPPGPQPQQIRRPARERLRQPPGGFGPSRQNCEFVCRAIHAAT
jgi:hypothetical protein